MLLGLSAGVASLSPARLALGVSGSAHSRRSAKGIAVLLIVVIIAILFIVVMIAILSIVVTIASYAAEGQHISIDYPFGWRIEYDRRGA